MGSFLLAKPLFPGARKLYVTGNEGLVEYVRKNYASVKMSEDEHVDFKTYNECLGVDAAVFVGYPFFNDWLRKDRRSTERLYREFRICSGFAQKEAYVGVGKRQSDVSEKERNSVYDCYSSYISFLETQGKIDPLFYPMPTGQEGAYDLIVADEAQNLSLGQLSSLFKLSNQGQVLYCLDPNQNASDACATRSLFATLLYDRFNKKVSNETLNTTYRCSKSVVDVLNAVLATKHELIGGKLDKHESPNVTTTPDAERGGFHIMEPNAIDRSWVAARLGHLAVITTHALKDSGEAARAFDTPLVFTPDQIHGQEFHTIIAYKLLADAPAVSESRESKPHSSHRAKAGKGDNALAPFLASYFTVCSRAIHTLVVVETITDKTKQWLDRFLPKEEKADSAIKELEHLDLKPVNWADLAKSQTEMGNSDVAKEIAKKHGSTPSKNPEATADSVASQIMKFFEKDLAANDPKKINKLLQKQNLDINEKGKHGCTALMMAAAKISNNASKNTNYNAFSAILSHKTTNVNEQAKNGLTALMMAATAGNEDIVTALLQKEGIDVNLKESNGLTALMMAATAGNKDIVT